MSVFDQKQVDISSGVIFRLVFIILGLWLLFLIRDILVLFLMSLILTATLDPVIDWMARKKISRPVGTTILYVVIFSLGALVISLLIPPLVGQFKEFSQNTGNYGEKLTQTFGGIDLYAKSYGINFSSRDFSQNLLGGFVQTSGQVFSTTVGVFTAFIAILVVLSLTFYMSVKEEGMNRFLRSIIPAEHEEYVLSLAERIKSKIGKWMIGQLALMLVIFLLDYAALSFFHVPYALILALLAGVLEIVPYLGPIISATLATLVGLLISPVTALIILATLTVIQQLESNVIVPQIMKKAVGLNPVVVILALLIGAQLGGTLGAILSVPIATAVSVFIGDLVNKEQAV